MHSCHSKPAVGHVGCSGRPGKEQEEREVGKFSERVAAVSSGCREHRVQGHRGGGAPGSSEGQPARAHPLLIGRGESLSGFGGGGHGIERPGLPRESAPSSLAPGGTGGNQRASLPMSRVAAGLGTDRIWEGPPTTLELAVRFPTLLPAPPH